MQQHYPGEDTKAELEKLIYACIEFGTDISLMKVNLPLNQMEEYYTEEDIEAKLEKLTYARIKLEEKLV